VQLLPKLVGSGGVEHWGSGLQLAIMAVFYIYISRYWRPQCRRYLAIPVALAVLQVGVAGAAGRLWSPDQGLRPELETSQKASGSRGRILPSSAPFNHAMRPSPPRQCCFRASDAITLTKKTLLERHSGARVTGAESLDGLQLAGANLSHQRGNPDAQPRLAMPGSTFVPPGRISCSASNLRSDSGKQTRTVMATPHEDVHGVASAL
jgi:hypothetical protein